MIKFLIDLWNTIFSSVDYKPPPITKIDITNKRQTTFFPKFTFASYDKKRKSVWNVPLPKADIINYESYILSDEWLESSSRLSKLLTTNGKCECCGSKHGTHVLCSVCHEYTHKMAGKGAGYYPPLQCPTTKKE